MSEQGRPLPAAAVFALAAALASPPALAQSGAKPQAVETNVDGVTVEVSEAVRKEGVLTIKLRFRNVGTAPVKVKFTSDFRDADTYYLVAGSTKFLVLKDSQKYPLMVQLDNYGGLSSEIKPGGSFLFWAKYPAPPAEAKKFTLYTPLTPPIEDVAVTDSK
jgi:hypothetical protein